MLVLNMQMFVSACVYVICVLTRAAQGLYMSIVMQWRNRGGGGDCQDAFPQQLKKNFFTVKPYTVYVM